MKPLLFIFLLSLPIALAMHAGQKENFYTLNHCSGPIRIMAQASLNISPNEFYLEGCNSTDLVFWNCSCSDDYQLNLSTNYRSVNEYTFTINYSYYHEKKSTTVGSSSHGGSGHIIPGIQDRYISNFSSKPSPSPAPAPVPTPVVPAEQPTPEPVVTPPAEQPVVNNTVQPVDEPKAPLPWKTILFWCAGILVVVGLGLGALYWYNRSWEV